MKRSPIRLPVLLLTLNWAAFIAMFAWTSSVQHNLSWWLQLDWGSSLTRFAAMTRLGLLPAGSVWILWLLLGATATVLVAWHAKTLRKAGTVLRNDTPLATAHNDHPLAEGAQWHLATDDPVVAAHDGLGEKIERLQKSLDRI